MLINAAVSTVRGGRLQCHLRFTGRVGAACPHTLQLPELLQGVQSGQAEGGVSIQGRPEQEEETEEQTQALPSYVLNKHTGLLLSSAGLYSGLSLHFQRDLMTSLMLRPWTPSATEQSASTWQRTLRALATDTAWCFTARCLDTHTHTLARACWIQPGFVFLGDSQKKRGFRESEGVVTLDPRGHVSPLKCFHR